MGDESRGGGGKRGGGGCFPIPRSRVDGIVIISEEVSKQVSCIRTKMVAQDGMPRCGWFQNIGSFHHWTMGYLLIENRESHCIGDVVRVERLKRLVILLGKGD